MGAASSPAASSATTGSSWSRRWGSWAAVAVVLVVGLAIGTFGQSTPTDAERARNLAETIRCPSCVSQAVASSDSPASLAVRALIAERIEAGDSDEEIRDYISSRFPDQNLLLDPSGSGFSGVVWGLPVLVVVIALAGLAFRFRDYRPGRQQASEADRDLVAEALGEDRR